MMMAIVILAIITLIGIFLVYVEDVKGVPQNLPIFVFCFVTYTLCIAFIFCGLMIEESPYKKPLVPKVKIECIDGKCDTTYIYKTINK
jgi:hypothetical protein